MYNDIERVLITKEELTKRVKELAAQLDKDYKDSCPLIVCILKGAYMFFADLTREMKIKHSIDFMAISSYGNGARSSGEVRMIKDLDKSIENRDVIIVEDIMDSGYTLSYLKRILQGRNPKSVKICALLDKPSRREVDIKADYFGFEIENYFVVGYGLDYAEIYRNMPEINILKPSIYEEK